MNNSAIIFFIYQAFANTIPFIAFFISLFFLGEIFSLDFNAYLFFVYFMTLISHDSFLTEKDWLESLYYNMNLKPYLQSYFLVKAFFLTTFGSFIYFYYSVETHLCSLAFFFGIIFFNTYLCLVLTFFFQEFLPFFLLPFLSLSLLLFNAFFLLSGLNSLNIWSEIKILCSLCLLFFSLIDYNFSYLLSLKFGPYGQF